MIRKRRKRKKKKRRYFTAINIIFNILDKFYFCCSCRFRAISKVIDNKSSATKKMGNSITVRKFK
jgi:hypothetical protein